MANPNIFISYRRSDSAYFSQWLAADLRNKFGEGSVFIDTQSIRVSDIWKSEIEKHLYTAEIVLVIIGKTWLSINDEKTARRRIDLADDWVRNEIEISLKEEKKIVPLLIDGAAVLLAEALPDSIRALAGIQPRHIYMDDITSQINQIGSYIASTLKIEIQNEIDMPPRYLVGKIDPLDQYNLKLLGERLPGWKIVQRQGPKGVKTELTRQYTFETFEDAIHFMSTSSRFISKYDHHPEWTNMWTTLTIYLSTWDIGFKPSLLDVDVAAYLDDLYRSYTQKFTKEDAIKLSRERAI